MKFDINDIKFKIIAVVLTTIAMLALLLFSLGFVIAHGPSEEAKYTFISKMEDSAFTKFVPALYFSQKERAAIKAAHDEFGNTKLDASDIDMLDSTVTGPGNNGFTTEEGSFAAEGIEVVDITKDTFKVKLMIVKDPERVFVGTPKNGYGVDSEGDTVYSIVKSNNAIAGISASAILGNEGGIPDGVVISNGALMWGNNTSSYQVAGIDSFGVLHVGKMKLEEITAKGIINAASFGPALIIDGEPQLLMESLPTARTAIGQRSDGALLLLTATPLEMEKAGATYNDLIDIFTEYNAINAANLYCQPNPTMIFGEQNIANGSLATDTPVAAAILVK